MAEVTMAYGIFYVSLEGQVFINDVEYWDGYQNKYFKSKYQQNCEKVHL